MTSKNTSMIEIGGVPPASRFNYIWRPKLTSTNNGEDTRKTPLRVLLVEDDKPLLEFFYTVLRREGYDVLLAQNGLEAMELAQSEAHSPIDILLTDVAMPYMGGIQLAESLREIQPGIRVLLTSGLPQKEVSDRCGPDFNGDFLAKPFSVSDLAGKVRNLAPAA